MIRSIKTKITIITASIFILFNLIIVFIQIDNYFNNKNLRISKYNNTLTEFKHRANLSTASLEQLAQYLSTMSNLNYKDKNELNYQVVNNLKKTPNASSCGIWFEPNVVKNKPRFSAFAYRDNDIIKIEPLNQAGRYDYFKNEWYFKAKKKLIANDSGNIYWSKPYPDALSNGQYMVTASALIVNKQKKVIGVTTADWLLKDIMEKLYIIAPTSDSIILLANKGSDTIIALKQSEQKLKNYDFKKYTGKSLKNLSWYNENLKNGDVKKIGNKYYMTFILYLFDDSSTFIIAEIPISSVYGVQRRNVIIGFFIQLIFAIIFIFIMRRFILNNLNKPMDLLIDATKKIGQGDFNTKIQIDSPKEFAQLAKTFNNMTLEIKEYLEDIKQLSLEKKQIEFDLNTAKEIQTSSLPSVYPDFYNIPNIEISPYIKMATKVGGDFYDFYFIDKDHIVFTIADVSGKGIPAAMFMMRSRILLKAMMHVCSNIEEAIKQANFLLSNYNDQELFITAAIGTINLKTGEVIYINAGHNPPVIKHENQVEYIKVPSNIVLGAFDDAKFEVTKFKLEPTDTIFLYTDGVTEGRNANNELYGSERLLEAIRQKANTHINITSIVKNNLQDYINGAEQFDDITMLGIKYLGNENICLNKNFVCKEEELQNLKDWLKNFADNTQIDNNKLTKLYIAAEEIFVNICNYAYPTNTSTVKKTVNVGLKYIKASKEINLVFIDSGIKYNPLELSEPDTNVDILQREEGGMGIYMVKNMMDNVEYEYNGKHNNLKLTYHV